MSDLSALQVILDQIPDKARVKRLIKGWEAEALDQRTMCWSEQAIIDLQKKMEQIQMNHRTTMTNTSKEALLTSTEAKNYLKIGMTMFIAYKNAGLIEVANQIGNKHLFSRAHLDNFLQVPAHQRNMILAEAKANAPAKHSRWARKPQNRPEAP